MSKFTIALHGGAGTISKKSMTPEKEAAYLKALNEALDAGYKLLEINGNALDAVKAAVIELENTILFNAGKGSVFTNAGTHEMDASIMVGLEGPVYGRIDKEFLEAFRNRNYKLYW